jgi:hypothetical protein
MSDEVADAISKTIAEFVRTTSLRKCDARVSFGALWNVKVVKV